MPLPVDYLVLNIERRLTALWLLFTLLCLLVKLLLFLKALLYDGDLIFMRSFKGGPLSTCLGPLDDLMEARSTLTVCIAAPLVFRSLLVFYSCFFKEGAFDGMADEDAFIISFDFC